MKRHRGLPFAAALVVSGALLSAQGIGRSKSGGNDQSQAPPELLTVLSESREREVALRIQAIAAEREKLQGQLALQGRAYIRLMRLGLLPLSSGFEGLVQHAGRVSGLSRAIERRLVLLKQLEAQTAALKEGLAEAQRQRAASNAELSDYQRSRDAIMAAREREAAYRRAFGGGTSGTAVYSATRSGLEKVNTFVELKGRLPLPVEGRAEVGEVDATTQRGPAVRLEVDIGTLARSVFKGRIVLIGDHEEGGRVVVVDHGGGYSTLVGQLQRVHVQPGDEVSRGAVLGESASVNGRGIISFEVRKDGVNLFPSDWFGL